MNNMRPLPMLCTGIVCFTLLCLTMQNPALAGKHIIVEQFEQLLMVLYKLVNYYSKHHTEMNLDGIFGLVPLRASIDFALHNIVRNQDINFLADSVWAYSEQVSESIHRFYGPRLKNLSSQIHILLPVAVLELAKREATHFEKMGFLFHLSWKPTQDPEVIVIEDRFSSGPYTSLNNVNNVISNKFERLAEQLGIKIQVDAYSSSPFYSTQTDRLTEPMSDSCMNELFVTQRNSSVCDPSPSCTNMLTLTDRSAYEVTHQLLYILVARQLNCDDSLAYWLSKKGLNMKHHISALCSRIYAEFLDNLSDTIKFSEHRDLMLEQIYVCGSFGFFAFARFPLLKHICSWQEPSGCFGDSNDSFTAHPTTLGGRSLLEERRLSGGCLAHYTSVAAAALSVYLRAYFQPNLDQYDPDSISLYEPILKHALEKDYINFPQLVDDDDDVDLSIELSDRSAQNWRPSIELTDELVFAAPSRFLSNSSLELSSQLYSKRSLAVHSTNPYSLDPPLYTLCLFFGLILIILLLFHRYIARR